MNKVKVHSVMGTGFIPVALQKVKYLLWPVAYVFLLDLLVVASGPFS